MVGSNSRSIPSSDKPAVQVLSPPTSQQDRKPTKAWAHTATEPSSSTSRPTHHRRKSSTNIEKGKTIATKSDAKPSRSQGESSAKRKEQNRIAQRAFRKRQKAHLEDLEAEVIEKGTRIKEITENNGVLIETMKQLQNQNIAMKTSQMPSALSYQLPFMTVTGTPLTPELVSNENSLGHASMSGHHQADERRLRDNARTHSISENSQSSSSDTHGSITSSPDVRSPATMQGAGSLRTAHLGLATALQLNLQPSSESTPYQTPISTSNSFHSPRDGGFPHSGFSFTSADNQHKQLGGPQPWPSFGGIPTVYQHAFGVPGQRFSADQQFSPLSTHTSRHPSDSGRSYYHPVLLQPVSRSSEALTQHHAHSMTDLTPSHASVGARPHTSISTSRDGNQRTGYSQMSASVPTSTRLLPETPSEMLLSRAYPSTPSQSVPIVSGFKPRVIPQHLTYQRPTQGYPSSPPDNIGLSFSPLDPPNLLNGSDLPYDYSTSSASYLSTLSIRPQPSMGMEMGKLPSPRPHRADSGSATEGWTDMMPSMGATTPLRELMTNENPLDTAGSAPLAIDQQNHSLSSSERTLSPEPSIFSLTGLDHSGLIEFPPYAPMQIFSSPPETREM